MGHPERKRIFQPSIFRCFREAGFCRSKALGLYLVHSIKRTEFLGGPKHPAVGVLVIFYGPSNEKFSSLHQMSDVNREVQEFHKPQVGVF